jgi:hypothetical protein
VIKIDIEKGKKYKLLGSDQILSEQIKAGCETLWSEIHKFIQSVWNKEELPDIFYQGYVHIYIYIYIYENIGDSAGFDRTDQLLSRLFASFRYRRKLIDIMRRYIAACRL